MKYWVVFNFILMALVFVIFPLWIGGYFEKLQEPIVIILPKDYSGVVCATSHAGSETRADSRYEVREDGLLLVGSDVLGSHRPRIFETKEVNKDKVRVLPPDLMFPIYTENDVERNESYTIMWVGNEAAWKEFSTAHSGESLCLGKY